jgi:hypothetical protein
LRNNKMPQRTPLTALALACLLQPVAASTAPRDTGPPTILALVLDTSGSVGAAELVRMRDVTLDILGGLPPGSEVVVLTFDDESRIIQPRTAVVDEVKRAIASAHVGGRFTALHDALYDASRTLRDAPTGRKAIVLVTDGKDENSALNLDDGLKVAMENGIPVYAIGVGRIEERVLRRVAKLTGGAYLPIDEVQGGAIAAGILKRAERQAPSAARPASPPPGSVRAAASPAPAPRPATPGPPGPLRGALVAALLAVAVAAGVLAWRRRRVPRCATCGRVLATPFSDCPFCAAAGSPATAAAPEGRHPQELEEAPPETVVARLPTGDSETLEKTVTLQEKPVLIITAGPGVGHVFALSPESMTSIGRARANDIVLDDVAVSSQHCRIRPDDGQFIVHDLRSTNGTFVNDHRVTRSHLRSGDVLKIGETIFQFRMDQKRP